MQLLGRKGAARSVLARELNMDSIVEMKENAEVEIEIHKAWNDVHVPIEAFSDWKLF